jgi:glycosyltransferase involved in cell wall biosynthesis
MSLSLQEGTSKILCQEHGRAGTAWERLVDVNDPRSHPSVTVVVLAYNESHNLEGACAEILDTLQAHEIQSEVIIVNDGSSDGTGNIADEIAARTPGVRVVHHSVNLGLGGGYRTGFAHSRGEFVTFFPADGQFPASIIPRFLSVMDQVDMALGYIPKRSSTVVARSLSYLERVLYRVAFGKMPTFQGILMFRRAILETTPLVSTGRGWAVLMELIIRTSRGPYRIRSIPNDMRARMSGESKVNNLRTIVANVRQIAELYWRL